MRLIVKQSRVASVLGSCQRETVKHSLIMLILFVSIIFLGCCTAIFLVNLSYGLLFIAIDQVLDVLILLFEFFLNFDVNELGVVNADRTSFRLLPHYLIN